MSGEFLSAANMVLAFALVGAALFVLGVYARGLRRQSREWHKPHRLTAGLALIPLALLVYDTAGEAALIYGLLIGLCLLWIGLRDGRPLIAKNPGTLG